jgi:hypothetical protein
MPFHRFLNCVYTWCLARIQPEKVEQWLYQLEQPIPGREDKASDAQLESEGDAFMDMMNLTQGA